MADAFCVTAGVEEADPDAAEAAEPEAVAAGVAETDIGWQRAEVPATSG